MSTSSGIELDAGDYRPTYPYLFIQGVLGWLAKRMHKGDEAERAWVESPDFDAYFREFDGLNLDTGHARKLLLSEWLVVVTKEKRERD